MILITKGTTKLIIGILCFNLVQTEHQSKETVDIYGHDDSSLVQSIVREP
eukprot:m.341497 g.341497  ORF g.341497 m.341497 type:complete len:50 (+) comp20146_c0_seq1:2047-2196(+)